MRNSFAIVITTLVLAGCTHRDAGGPPPGDEITFTPRATIRGDEMPADTGRVPGGASGASPVRLDTGWFLLTGTPVPGSASFTHAMVWDPFVTDMPPFGTGGVGTEDVTVSGARYTVTGDAFVARYTDDDGTEYLILSAFAETRDAAGGWWQNNVAVFVLASDFAPGATVALDGVDRVAVFAAGPETAPEPTVFAAAVTGHVTFGAAGSAAVGDRIDATLAADFAPAMATVPPAAGGVSLVAGNYDLVIDPAADVLCGGTMTGHEASFARETLAVLGTADGTVSLALPTADTAELRGSAVGAGWGDPLVFDAVAHPEDTFVALHDIDRPGPDASILAGSYWLLEGLPASAGLVHAAIGLAYVDPAGDGGCDVVWYAELHARP